MGTSPTDHPPVKPQDSEIPELSEGALEAAQPDLSDKALRLAALRAADFESSVENLPLNYKLIALLGIKNPVELKTLPEPFQAFTIKIPRASLKKTTEILNEFALPCSSDFIGNPDDELVTLTYIAQDPANILHIMAALREQKLEANINASADRTVVIRIPENHIISLHRNLNDDATHPSSSLPAAEIAATSGTSRPLALPKDMDAMPKAIGTDTSHATLASLNAAVEAMGQEFKMPREGRCVYLMIDQNFLERQSSENQNLIKLRDEIELIRQSQNFHITGYNGYLVIIGTAERAGSSLTAMATRIFRTIPSSKIFLGSGEVRHNSGAETFAIADFPKTETRHKWTQAMPGTYVTQDFHRQVTDPNSRDSTLCQISVKEEETDDLLRLTDFRAKVSLRIGGPDRLIGYEAELKNLVEALTDSRNRLTIVRGTAGMGKSRLIEESLKHLPEATVCSLDPSGKNIPGFSLMTVAEQLTAKLRADDDLSRSQEARALFEFNLKSQKEKIKQAQSNPDRVVTMCLNALKLTNAGKMPFIIDDFHHGDRFSIPHITNLAERYMAESGGKVVLAMRPEEMFDPQDVGRIKRAVNARYSDPKTINDVNIEGLDFNDGAIARAFAFYSLPEELRDGKSPESLGNWPLTLGHVAGRSPFVMKTFMDEILAEQDETLTIKKTSITVNPTILNRIRRIKSDSDLGTYYLERLNSLPENGRKILQIIALMGGSVTLPQIRTVMTEVTGMLTKGQAGARIELLIIDNLVKAGYLVKNPGEEETWSLQHETIREIAANLLGDEERIKLSKQLHGHFRADRHIHTDRKFAIAHDIASDKNAPEASDEFWQQYLDIAHDSLDEAGRFNAFGRAYQIAATILDKDRGARAVNEDLAVLEDARKGQETSTLINGSLSRKIIDLGIRAIMTKAQNALHLGRFNETRELAARIELIHQNNPTLHLEASTMKDCNLLLFQAAYFERNAAEMEKIYEEKLKDGKDLPAHELAICKMRLQFRRKKYDEAIQTYSDYHAEFAKANDFYKKNHDNAPCPEVIEAVRLATARCPFEQLRNAIKADLDEDIEIQPGTASLEQVRKLFEIKNRLEMLLELRKEHPLTFNPYEEMALLEQYGLVCAMLGDYEKALETFAETWRQANQLEVHQQAARVAKSMGDILTTQGILIVTKRPDPSRKGETSGRTVLDRAAILNGLKKYTKEGMISLAQMPEQNNFYHMAIRIQRIRNVGLLYESYKNELDSATKPDRARIEEELTPMIKMAIEDFLTINEITKTQIQKRDKHPYHKNAEVCYYLISYLGYMLEAAKKFGMEMPANLREEAEFPLLGNRSCHLAFEFSRTVRDNGLGEKKRKETGFGKLAEFLTFQS